MSRPRFPKIPVPAAFEPFDTLVDDWFEAHLRHHGGVDLVMYGASAVGDHGMVWLGLAGLQALRRSRQGEAWTRQFGRVAVGLGAESVVVNGPVKFMFRRTRPVHDRPRPMHLRQPRTSSFPSGHAAAAFFGAALLRDDDPIWPLYYVLAVIVAASRIHVRIHHASDVIGGVLTGVALGELVRRLVPLEPAEAPLAAPTGAHPMPAPAE
ncbi:MAG TPA: phosphatase PAP2 family protein [Acidimicrobiales bacterium]|nr:phosphatase PAP2 family protein [Acidimicrobiales bacterium]